MCGRYSTTKDIEDLVREFEVQRVDVAENLRPDYNVAPTKQVPAILSRVAKDGERSGESTAAEPDPERHLRLLTWGLVPFWAKDRKIGNRMINARLETASSKPAYRKAFSSRRCLLPADGYYEWYATEQLTAAGKPKKQPFFIRPKDGGTLAMAGLYEIWRDPDKPDDASDRFLWTCTILTTSAEDAVGKIHDRMPLTLEPGSYGTWLDPRITDTDAVRELLLPAGPGRLEAYPVSTAVNSVRNNGPELVEPIPAED